jgi:hypothetical protein
MKALLLNKVDIKRFKEDENAWKATWMLPRITTQRPRKQYHAKNIIPKFSLLCVGICFEKQTEMKKSAGQALTKL